MTAKFKIEGEIEIDLTQYDIKGLEAYKSESMKKAFLENLLEEKLHGCALAGENELGIIIDFDNLFVAEDWKYAGNMRAKNEQYGSPLAITLDDFPTTNEEVVDNAMKEIGERKQRH